MDITWAEQRVTEPPMIADADFRDYLLGVWSFKNTFYLGRSYGIIFLSDTFVSVVFSPPLSLPYVGVNIRPDK